MGLSLLKKIDPISKLYPHPLNLGKTVTQKSNKPCLIRPGGLGDLVVLTRACRTAGISLNHFDWIVEKRNAVWLEFLSVPHLCYDRFADLKRIATLYGHYQKIIVSEQYHGLAAVVASYLSSRNAEIVGFDSNPRVDIFSTAVIHDRSTNHELHHFTKLLEAAKVPAETNNTLDQATSDLSDPTHLVVALSGEFDQAKSLSPTQWGEIISHATKYSLPIYLVGTEIFTNLADNLSKRFPEIINIVGKESFSFVVEKIKTAHRFVGIDSGLMHVADYYGIASNVVFTSDNIKQWQPLTKGSRIVRSVEELS